MTDVGVLAGLRVIEVSSFVAAPLGGMTLAQLGADVIRVDPVGGAADQARWPRTANGASLYWAGLNKGKRSVTIDFRSPRGQELIAGLITAPGPDRGILLTNAVGRPGPRGLVGGTADRVDADNVGTELSQRHPAQRRGDEAGDLDDPQPGQDTARVGHDTGGGDRTNSTSLLIRTSTYFGRRIDSSAVGSPVLDPNPARSSQADAAVGDLFQVAPQLT